MGEQGGDKACVADGAHMRATVAQTHHRIFVQDHVAAAVEVVFRVVSKRGVEQRITLILQQHVIDVGPWIQPTIRRLSVQRILWVGFVVRRIGHQPNLASFVHQPEQTHKAVTGWFVQNTRLACGIRESGNTLSQWQFGHFRERWSGGER